MTEKLTQAEIDALREAVSEGKVEAITEQPAPPPAEVKVVAYDFRRPKLLSAERMQALTLLHQTLSSQVQGLLFSMLKHSGDVSLAAVDQVSYGEFQLSVENPTYLLGLRAEPEFGSMEIEMTSPMGQIFLDLLLGGDGIQAALEPARAFSALEMDILRTFSDRFLEEFIEVWASIQEVGFSVYTQGVTSDQVQIVPPDTPCLCVSLRLRMEESEGRVNICYPFSTLQSVFQKSDARQDELTGRKKDARETALRAIQPVSLSVQVELGCARITARELTRLEVGDVVRLDRRIGDPLALNIADRKIGLSQAGSHRGRLAACVDSLVRPKKTAPPVRPAAPPRPAAASASSDSQKKKGS
jgi:flagellar motor switch protein FliM